MSLGYGENIVSARRYTYLSIGAFTANTADVATTPRFGVPVGCPNARVLGVHISGDAIPSDPDGVLTVNGFINDVSEGGDDTLVSVEDMETLLTAADQLFEATMEADGAEEIRTLEPGDTIRFELTNDSAAITTNPNLVICIEWMSVPRNQSDEDEPSYVGHPSQMTDF